MRWTSCLICSIPGLKSLGLFLKSLIYYAPVENVSDLRNMISDGCKTMKMTLVYLKVMDSQ